jgi:hypothetical protein
MVGRLPDRVVVLRRLSLEGSPRLVLVECDGTIEVDRDWYRGAGMRASESHRVHFHDTAIVSIPGEPGELGREPWFSRDAMRAAAGWAG